MVRCQRKSCAGPPINCFFELAGSFHVFLELSDVSFGSVSKKLQNFFRNHEIAQVLVHLQKSNSSWKKLRNVWTTQISRKSLFSKWTILRKFRGSSWSQFFSTRVWFLYTEQIWDKKSQKSLSGQMPAIKLRRPPINFFFELAGPFYVFLELSDVSFRPVSKKL